MVGCKEIAAVASFWGPGVQFIVLAGVSRAP